MFYKFPQASQPGEPYSMEYPVEYLKWSTSKSHVQLYCSKKMLNHLDVHISALFSQFRPCDICPERQGELFLLPYPRPSVHIIHEKTNSLELGEQNTPAGNVYSGHLHIACNTLCSCLRPHLSTPTKGSSYVFLGSCPATPPLSQHLALSKK